MRAVLTALFLILAATRSMAAELVMVEEHGCHWCARWNSEIGDMYHLTSEGRRAPLRRVQIGALPANLEFARRPSYTPTFVLFEEGREIGRIEGHPGPDFFWPLLQRLLDQLPPGGA